MSRGHVQRCSSGVCAGLNLYLHAVRPPTCAPSCMCTHLESRVTHSRATPSPLFCANDLVPSSACADLNGHPRTIYFRRDEMKRAQGQLLLGRSRTPQVSHERPLPLLTASPPPPLCVWTRGSENPRLSRALGVCLSRQSSPLFQRPSFDAGSARPAVRRKGLCWIKCAPPRTVRAKAALPQPSPSPPVSTFVQIGHAAGASWYGQLPP